MRGPKSRAGLIAYPKEQLSVWATGQVDLEKWNESFQEHFSVVVVDDEIIVALEI